jgi:hypothetical protein
MQERGHVQLLTRLQTSLSYLNEPSKRGNALPCLQESLASERIENNIHTLRCKPFNTASESHISTGENVILWDVEFFHESTFFCKLDTVAKTSVPFDLCILDCCLTNASSAGVDLYSPHRLSIWLGDLGRRLLS